MDKVNRIPWLETVRPPMYIVHSVNSTLNSPYPALQSPTLVLHYSPSQPMKLRNQRVNTSCFLEAILTKVRELVGSRSRTMHLARSASWEISAEYCENGRVINSDYQYIDIHLG